VTLRRALALAIVVGCTLSAGASASGIGFAGLSAEQARVKAVKLLHVADPKTSLVIVTAGTSFDPVSGRNAWLISFRARHGFGSGYSGCDIYVWRSGSRAGDKCKGWRN
jgi:hypothetical protein